MISVVAITFLLSIFIFGQEVEDVEEGITTRLGLLGPSLGLSPVGEANSGEEKGEEYYYYDYDNGGGDEGNLGSVSAPLTSVNDPTQGFGGNTSDGKDDYEYYDTAASSSEEEDFTEFLDKLTDVPASTFSLEQCCCVPPKQGCLQLGDQTDLLSVGLIQEEKEEEVEDQLIFTRSGLGSSTGVVTRPGVCPPELLGCCYPPSVNISRLEGDCFSPVQAQQQVAGTNHSWVQGCSEREPVAKSATKECGTRVFREKDPVRFSSQDEREKEGEGDSLPGEFPWTCLVLTKTNNFVGTCVVLPSSGGLGNTMRVLVAAHKFSTVEAGSIKVRVGEQDIRGFFWPEEEENFQEHLVKEVVMHPKFDRSRLENDVAVLVLEREVDMAHPHVNSVCLPSCRDQFSHQFSNGSGLLCWVSGWGRGKGKLHPTMKQVPLTLVDSDSCNTALKPALDLLSPGLGARFSLSGGEVCARGDTCGDQAGPEAGSPLVCRAQSGRWTLVGLLTWAMDDCSVPGVFARMAEFSDWLEGLGGASD